MTVQHGAGIGSFVGREAELAALRAGVRDAVEGRGRLILLSGEPGIGKTRTGVINDRRCKAMKLLRLGVGLLSLEALTAAADGFPPYAPIILQPGQKICQVVGECDRERGGAGQCTNGMSGQPTLNLTESRYGLFGTDEGATFEHNGHLYVFFGDTWPSTLNPPPTAQRLSGVSDSAAFSDDTNPEDCLALQFVTSADGYWRPLEVTVPPGDPAKPVTLGAFETPTGGFSAGGKMYVFFHTDAVVVDVLSSDVTIRRSVLARSTDDAQSFTHVYDASTDKFINIAPAVVNNADIAGLPSKKKQGLLLWGSSTAYRKSDPYLAYVPLDAVEDHSAWRYFAGLQNGTPSWSTQESAASPLFSDTPCIGELSVSWNPFVRKWLMLYNCLAPFGIVLRTAAHPWGPWSSATVNFDPSRDGAYCHYMHLPGSCDTVSDFGREGEIAGPYGPRMIPRFTQGDTTSTTVYYLMSTWNPYVVVLMKTTLQTRLPCAATPLPGCRKPTVAGASTFQLKKNASGAKSTLTWKWKKGETTTAADFGDPLVGSTDYTLCVYDSTPSLLMSASAPAGGVCGGKKPCWASKKTGFKYANKDLTPDGLLQLQLTAGVAGKASIVAQGKGTNLVLPELPLTETPNVVVQLQNSGGACWEADYSAPATKNDGTQFNDTSD